MIANPIPAAVDQIELAKFRMIAPLVAGDDRFGDAAALGCDHGGCPSAGPPAGRGGVFRPSAMAKIVPRIPSSG